MNTHETITIKPANLKGERGVFLHIPDAKFKKHRYIGFIKNRTFFSRREKHTHTFHKNNSIGISYKLLSEGGKYFDYIVIEYGSDLLQTSREYYLKYGFFLHFQKNGLERQKFLKISDFGLDKVNRFENERVIQLNNQLKNFGNVLKNKAVELQEGLF